jgi:CO/xanthine dehydrogenase FAD-binding subunit
VEVQGAVYRTADGIPMTIAIDLSYTAPASLEEALEALAAGNGRVALLAGGTDLVPWMRDGLAAPELVIDLKRIPGLDRVEVVDDTLHVGCLATFTDLLHAPVVRERVPVLAEMAGMVASVGVRNRATMVGNICAAVPCCDAGPVLLALGAEVHVAGPGDGRLIPIDDWFAGPRETTIQPGEIVTHVTLPLPDPAHGAAYARLSRTRGEDLAQASVAVLVEPGHRYRVAFGAVAPTPVRAARIEDRLDGNPLGPEVLEDAVALVPEEVQPITDVRATERYRLRMCEVMLRRALTAATGRAAGDGPAYGTPLM